MTAAASEWAAPHTDERDERPVRPGRDSFYDAPPGLAAMAPGTIIRTRRVRLGLLGLIPQRDLEVWQLAYRSNNLHDEPEVAVSTVIVPSGATGERKVVAYQCAIDAVSDRCFPSYALRPGSRSWGALPQFELMIMAEVLARGYTLSVADHEGRLGTFAAPREPGYRVLDALRAAIAFDEVDIDESTPIGAFGYSGGGMASAWAAEMAPTYAPELNLVGAVLGSPVGDPGEAFIKLNDGPYAGLPALVVSGLQHVYPGLGNVVRRHTNLEGRKRLDRLQEISTVEAVLRYAFDDFDDYIDAPLADVLAEPAVMDVFEDLRLGKHAPTCPLLVVQSVHDRIIDKDDVDEQVRKYVDEGASVSYLRDRLSEHIVLMLVGLPTMLDWLEDRFEGRDAKQGTRTVWSLALSPRSVLGYLRLGRSSLRTALGRMS